jgi:hypothetical protein
MKKANKIVICFTLLWVSAPTHAVIAKEGCIKKISEILNHLPKKGATDAIFDWDETISSKNGEYEMREMDPHTGTLSVLKKLHEKEIGTMVLTARLSGIGLAGDEDMSGQKVKETLEVYIKQMIKALETTDWLKHGALASYELQELDLQPDSDFDDYILIFNQIAFSGGASGKGEAISKMIDEGLFKKKPKNILFIDNKKSNVDEVRVEFENRDEHVYLFHYPAANDKPQCNHQNAIK